MVDSGEMVRVDHGLYRLADAPTHAYSDWDDIAAKYTTEGFTICFLSAAKYHGLVMHMPAETWVAMPLGAKPTKLGLRTVYWRRSDSSGNPHPQWHVGINHVEMDGRRYRITSPARTVVDLYRWREIVPDGHRAFLESLASYDNKKFERSELRKIAQHFGVQTEISDLLRAKSEFTNGY
jgi:predicted transcriptional regulator of viral defense system